MPELPRDGYQIHYTWAGNSSGPVLALSHSLGTSLEMWCPQVARWGEKFRILLYDHPGHGKSSDLPISASPAPIDMYGADFLALLDHLHLDRVAFCGLSLGGMIGLWLGAHAGERLNRLVVSNTAARIESRDLLQARIAEIRQNGLSSIVENVLQNWFTAEFREASPDICDAARAMLASTNSQAYADTAQTVCDLDLRGGLSSIEVPTLVISGQADRATPPAWGRAIADAIPGAASITLPAAHLSNLEAAEAFNEAVWEFLG